MLRFPPDSAGHDVEGKPVILNNFSQKKCIASGWINPAAVAIFYKDNVYTLQSFTALFESFFYANQQPRARVNRFALLPISTIRHPSLHLNQQLGYTWHTS